MKHTILVLVLLLASSSAMAEPGHVPKLLVSTDWGARFETDDVAANGGLGVTVRRPSRNAILVASGQAQLVGGTFGVRAGGLFGASYTTSYSESRILHSFTSGSTTYIKGLTTTYHDRPIRGVAGFALSASTNTYDYGHTSNAQLEIGLGMCAQHCAEAQYVKDVTNGGTGFRIAGTVTSNGDLSSHIVFRYAVSAMWSDDVSFAILTLGVGFGSGYGWR